ncbi:hypothetical protein C7A12_07940 [Pseudomonas fluorescens]|uniref:hypothetical protein n=2 Tax=Pseudomonas TaxID=286 RepID=UPI000D030DC1|nr:hypothetical protein [Pseudomonas fluorescens]PRW79062.1 hypothetical protein C7A12_07940 [Pseudomonas fluorescens]PRW82328.1 hypothetical protein C7A13_03620 [Pseudomonas fluorescens]
MQIRRGDPFAASLKLDSSHLDLLRVEVNNSTNAAAIGVSQAPFWNSGICLKQPQLENCDDQMWELSSFSEAAMQALRSCRHGAVILSQPR